MTTSERLIARVCESFFYGGILIFLIMAVFALCGCTLAEWGNVASDAGGLFDGVPAPPLADGTTEPDGWSILQWNTGGAAGSVVLALSWLFRRSLARGFGRALTTTKGLLGR